MAEPTRLVLLGPPGVGKGTQAARLAQRFGVPHIATGELLRAAIATGLEPGETATATMAVGELLPDQLVTELVRMRLARPDASVGFILDGFPRTLPQATALQALLAARDQSLTGVVWLEASNDVLLARLSKRRALLHRSDDQTAAIRQRLAVYRAETVPLLTYYGERRLAMPVVATGTIREVTAHILAALGQEPGGQRSS